MASDSKANMWKDLRKPFPKGTVGHLPKAGIQLEYVGHAAVTDRFLEVDPSWTYDFKAVDDFGNPVLDKEGNLWILLTIGGVTRPGVGDGKNMKERIGDALRNAGMRFGVALDLWSKEELESHLVDPSMKNEKPKVAAPHYNEPSVDINDDVPAPKEDRVSLIKKMNGLLKEQGHTTPEKATIVYEKVLGKKGPATVGEIKKVIASLEKVNAA